MAKANLNDLIEWLKRDDKNRFEIYDLDRNESIEKCASYEDLSAHYGDAQSYFENLLSKGVKTIQVVKKRKNGSTYVREGCGLNFGLSSGSEAYNNVAASGLPESPAATTQRPYNSGLMGLGSPGLMGLGFPEIMTMRSQADRYEEAKTELQEVKAKLATLEAENRRLETECLTHKLGIESKPSAVDKLVEGLASNPAALATLVQSFKGGNTVPGLNSPQPEAKKLSDTKSTVVDLISNNAQLTDDSVTAAYYILIESLKGNEKFLDEYLKLLQKHQLIQDGSNSNNYSNQ